MRTNSTFVTDRKCILIIYLILSCRHFPPNFYMLEDTPTHVPPAMSKSTCFGCLEYKMEIVLVKHVMFSYPSNFNPPSSLPKSSFHSYKTLSSLTYLSYTL